MNTDFEQLVTAAYNVLFDRDPEPGGLKHWASALRNGMSRAEFLQACLASAEFQTGIQYADSLAKYNDVDLIIPLQAHQFRVPASDRSLVPHLLEHRSWEPHLSSYFSRHLRPTDVFLDAGANLGYFTTYCSPLVNRVISFEPVSGTFEYCKVNVALNNLTNVEMFQYALWNEDVTIPIKVDPSSLMAASICAKGEATSVESVRCVSLDNIISSGELDLPRLDMVKMDIEGAEAHALQGMESVIRRLHPKIVMELNNSAMDRFGTSIETIWDFFYDSSYLIFAFEHWEKVDPVRITDLDKLKELCAHDGVIDILAST